MVGSPLRTSWWRGRRGPEAWQWGPLPPAYAADWEASGRSFPVLAAQCWKILMDAFADARELVPADQWMDVRFEDVLADTHARLKEMLAFAKIALSPDRQQDYRRQLDPASIALVERSLSAHLAAWGYEPSPA